MTPQSNFMVAAPIAARTRGCAACTARDHEQPSAGVVDPNNALVPFARFERLHVARFVILHDQTLDDLAQYGETFPDAPVWLVFLGDCDGHSRCDAARSSRRYAGAGLARIFSHCEDFDDGDLLAWMRRHTATPAAQYINWVGRTVRQIREEAALHAALRERCVRDGATFTEQAARDRPPDAGRLRCGRTGRRLPRRRPHRSSGERARSVT